jgi:hypothetical protein
MGFARILNFKDFSQKGRSFCIPLVLPDDAHDIYLLFFSVRSLPGGIILQGVLLLQGSRSIFACHYG